MDCDLREELAEITTRVRYSQQEDLTPDDVFKLCVLEVLQYMAECLDRIDDKLENNS